MKALIQFVIAKSIVVDVDSMSDVYQAQQQLYQDLYDMAGGYIDIEKIEEITDSRVEAVGKIVNGELGIYNKEEVDE